MVEQIARPSCASSSGAPLRRPCVAQCLRTCVARFVGQQLVDVLGQFGHARRRVRPCSAEGEIGAAASAQQVGHVAAQRQRRLVEQQQPRGFGHLARVERRPDFVEPEQLARPRRTPLPTWSSPAPSSSASSNGWIMPMRLTIRLASSVRDHLAAAAGGRGSALAEVLAASARGKSPSSSGSTASSSASALASIASCSTSLVCDSSTASSGRVRPLPSAARRARSRRRQALGLAVELAAVPRASRSAASSAATAAAPPVSAIDSASACRRLSSSTSVGDFVGHLGEQRVAPLLGQLAGAPGGGQRDLDVDLVVRAIDARRNCR